MTKKNLVRFGFAVDAAAVAAATGASVGKLNLSLVDSSADDVATTYRKKSTGQTITLRPTATFRARFADVPRERAREFGREVLRLADADVFEEVPSSRTAEARRTEDGGPWYREYP
jgi:hypothetical protein